ncbi:MAG: iron ABC transporter permease [Deltaproteobacteria bacterium]|nr:iron ABC transporter permease [Deltaproteobacteria bacterium]
MNGALSPRAARTRRHGARGLRTARTLPLLAGLSAVCALALLIGLGVGAVSISPTEILAIGAAQLGAAPLDWPGAERQAAVLLAIRLPRVLLGALTGGALAASGAALQALFRNPLADPALIGTASGAALAAAAVIVLLPAMPGEGPTWLRLALLPACAFVGSAIATFAVYHAARRDGQTPVATLLLAGIAINALAGAGTGLLAFAANDAQLRSLTFWTLGSLGSATWAGLAAVTPFLAVALVALPRLAPALNLLLLGEDEARHLGVDVDRLKRGVVLAGAVGVGAAVALCGVIGFVGLVVPHLVRLLAGPDHRIVLPGSIALGAALLVLADVVARTVVAPAELPLGVVTALVGGPFFLWLLRRQPAAWG